MQLCILFIVIISQKIVSGYQNVRKLICSKFIICILTLNDSTALYQLCIRLQKVNVEDYSREIFRQDKLAIFVNISHSQLKVFFHHNVGIILTTNLLFEYILLSTNHKMMLGNNKTTFKLKSKQLCVVMLLYQAMHRHVQQFFF